MDVRTVVMDVLGTTLDGTHGHPRFSFPFPSGAVSLLLLLLLPVSLPLTSAATGTPQHFPVLRLRRGLPQLPHLLQFPLTLLPLTLLLLPLLLPFQHLLSRRSWRCSQSLDAVIAIVAAAAIATTESVVVHSAAGTVGAADAVCAFVAMMTLPRLRLMSSVFGVVLQLVG